MAAILSTVNISSPNTDVQVYQVPSGKILSFSLNVTNRTSGKVLISIAISENATPGLGDWIEFGAEVLPNDTLQRLGLVLPASFYVFVKSNTASVGAQIWGFLE
jgi:hypothetical protein